MAKLALRLAFEALEKELDRLYGVSHNHDFQDELDVLDAEIAKLEAANVTNNKPGGGQVTGKVGQANGEKGR